MKQKCIAFICCAAIMCVVASGMFITAPVSFAGDAGIGNIPYEGTGLAPDCEYIDCDFTDVYDLIERIIKVLIWVAVFGVSLVIIWQGGKLAINPLLKEDAPATWTEAKGKIRTAILGLIIVLSAWLIVDFVFRQLGYRDADNLFRAPEIIDPLQPPGLDTRDPTKDLAKECNECVPLAGSFLPHKNQQNNGCAKGTEEHPVSGCRANKELVSRLQYLYSRTLPHSGSTSQTQITESWPPTVSHRSACHNNGTCVDVGFKPLTRVRSSASASGHWDHNELVKAVHDFFVATCHRRESGRVQQKLYIQFEVNKDWHWVDVDEIMEGLVKLHDSVGIGECAREHFPYGDDRFTAAKAPVITVPGVTPHFSVYMADYGPDGVQCNNDRDRASGLCPINQ